MGAELIGGGGFTTTFCLIHFLVNSQGARGRADLVPSQHGQRQKSEFALMAFKTTREGKGKLPWGVGADYRGGSWHLPWG